MSVGLFGVAVSGAEPAHTISGAAVVSTTALITLTPSADAYVTATSPDQNFGSSTSLRTDGDPAVRSYLSFAIPSVPGTITNITLRLFATSSSSTGYDVYAVPANTWIENSVTDRTKPSLGGLLGSSGSFVASTWTEVGLPAQAQPAAALTYAVLPRDARNVTYASREVSATRPQMVIEYDSDPTTQPPPTPQPDVVRAAFYYPWFPQTWGKDPSNPFTVYHPSLGYYSSDDPAVLAKHFAAMRYANLNTAIVSWWGQNTQSEASRIPKVQQAAFISGLKSALYYEKEGFANPSVAELAADLTYVQQRYATADGYLKRGGRPVIMAFGDAADNCDSVRRWNTANAGRFFVVLKVFTGYRDCADQPDAWHQYGPARAESHQVGQSFTISPGFWLKGEASPRLARDPGRWANNIRNMVASQEPFQLVTTFSEWGEGTAVESADRMANGSGGGWASASGYGTYIDLLHANLPPVSPPLSSSVSASVSAPTSATSSSASPSSPRPSSSASPSSSSPSSSSPSSSSPSSSSSPPSVPAVTIAAAGDISCEPGKSLEPAIRCAEPLTADVVVAMNPAGVLALGDLQYEAGDLASFRSEYDPAWGRFKSKTYPAPGNHEWLTPNAQGYRDYFSSGVPPEVDVTRLYYSFNLGAWHFVSLDSDCKASGGCSATGSQNTWLKSDLANSNGRPTVVYWHHPRYTSDVRGDNTSMSATWSLLVADRDVQLVLSGHTHNYERFAPMGTSAPDPTGIRQFVVGTGGRNHTCPSSTRHAGSQVSDCTTFGVLRLTLNGDGSYRWLFAPAAGTGSFTDQGSQPRR